ncbi:TPA: preprotein translocase subunit SecA [bacterium]|nr:preprotein translocase subunit SecA [bacterium]
MANWISRLFKVEEKRLKRLNNEADKVLEYEEEMKALTDEELKAKTPYFKKLLEEGKTLNDIRHEAYAVAREAARRVLNEFPYRVQVMGAIVLNEGDVAEMKTGEGKTLTATMAVYLNALEGKGVHIITVNEYLAKRDAEWMGQIYRFLGLTVGVNLRELSSAEKRAAYNCDVTYSTSSEVGFDYLRDNMATSLADKTQRELHFALVDEADSILIDEGRTPLIISGGSKQVHNYYTQADKFVKSLKSNHLDVDIEKQTAILTDAGVAYAEKAFNLENLYTLENTALVHHINQALRANYIMKRDKDYTVIKGEVIIIDQSTGRLMQGRAYSNGLHQAIEAKEGVRIKQETMTIATITYQNFFRLYTKLSGMTGTAKTEEEELKTIYNMNVIEIPTNKPMIRIDANDLVYNNLNAKYKALINEVKERHEKGQPILIGTSSVENSEVISELLRKEKIKHEVLNAKNHEREADIIAKAGHKGAVTVATNMAGRGTDIKLAEGVKELGGLAVLGSERNESRRVDNQLRGRAGRQGDPGYSRFYVSLEDDLMLRFGNLKDNRLFASMKDQAIDSKFVTKLISSAQVKVEGAAFDSRKNVLEYDEVLRQQREVMYKQRDEVLGAGDIREVIVGLYEITASNLVDNSSIYIDHEQVVEVPTLQEAINKNLRLELILDEKEYQELPIEEVKEKLKDTLLEMYKAKVKGIPKENIEDIEKKVAIAIIDRYWTQHIDNMEKLKIGVRYMAYAQVNPLNKYVNDGYEMFSQMMSNIAKDVVMYTLGMKIVTEKKEDLNE